MNTRVRILSAVCALLCVAGSLLLTRCADKGTDPPPAGPKDYAVFIGDFTVPPYKLYRYRVVSGKLDSTTNEPQTMISPTSVSADGKRLYWHDGTVMDAETFEALPALPYQGHVAPSPDNKLLAVCDTDLFILRTSDYAVVFHDTDAVSTGIFSSNNKRFYGKLVFEDTGALGNYSPMYSLDLEHGNRVTRRYIKGGLGTEPLVVSPDETKLYLYKHYWNFWHSFDVYDLQLDTVIFSKPLAPGGGSLAQTPDGKNVYFTNPGTWQVGPPATYALGVYYAETMTIDTFMLWGPICWSNGNHRLTYDHVVVTADGRWLVGTSTDMMTIIRRDLADLTTTTQCLVGRDLRFPRTQNGL